MGYPPIPPKKIGSDQGKQCWLEGHAARVTGATFHPTQKLVAVNVWDHDPDEDGCIIGFTNIRLFTFDGMLVRQFARYNGPVPRLAFSPDGKLLTVTHPKSQETEFMNISTGKVAFTLPKYSRPPAIQFHPTKKQLVVLTENSFEIWDTLSGKKSSTTQIEGDKTQGAVAWASGGDLLLTATAGKLTFWKPGTEPTDDWIKLRSLPLSYQGVTKMSVTPDGSRIITETVSLDKWNHGARMMESWGLID